MRGGRWLLALSLLQAATVARAQSIVEAPELPAEPSMSDRLMGKLSLLSDDVSDTIGTVTFHVLDVSFDPYTRTARLHLGGGDDRTLGLHIDGDVAFSGDHARVKAHIDVGIAGKRLAVTLPDVDMVARSLEGHRYLEVRVPLAEWRF